MAGRRSSGACSGRCDHTAAEHALHAPAVPVSLLGRHPPLSILIPALPLPFSLPLPFALPLPILFAFSLPLPFPLAFTIPLPLRPLLALHDLAVALLYGVVELLLDLVLLLLVLLLLALVALGLLHAPLEVDVGGTQMVPVLLVLGLDQLLLMDHGGHLLVHGYITVPGQLVVCGRWWRWLSHPHQSVGRWRCRGPSGRGTWPRTRSRSLSRSRRLVVLLGGHWELGLLHRHVHERGQGIVAGWKR